MARFLPRPLVNLILIPVATFYFLFIPRARTGAAGYIRRRFRGRGPLRCAWHSWRHTVAFAHVLCDKAYLAARAFRRTDEARELEPRESALQLLTGHISLIYEIPEVCGMHGLEPDYRLAGPIFWERWNEIGDTAPWRRESGTPTVYVNAGTFTKSEGLMRAMVAECRSRGLRAVVSSGEDGLDATDKGVFYRPFLRPSSALSLADVVVSTGGVGACYTKLRYGVPTLVTPMQPEQATNGLNLARAECAEVYRSNVPFLGNSRPYYAPFDAARFGSLLDRMLSHPSYRSNTKRLSQTIAEVNTRARVVGAVKELL